MQLIGSEPVLSPSDFVAVFNQSVEAMYPTITIVGELSNLKVSKGKWVYFNLVDDNASLKFFGTVRALPGPLEEGMNLEVVGSPRLHPHFGFSINVGSIQVVGRGSIAKAQQLLEKKLEHEGLFAEKRKRSLPYPPQKIGLISSIESAGYADFIKIANKRWPSLEISVIDTLVQGMQAPGQLVEALENFNQSPKEVDVIVIVRGGGSADDLAAFSTEAVVRAVASSRIPTIVAIGHETDVSLAELAADRRASTPSNAAEMIVPGLDEERARITSIKKLLNTSTKTFYDNKARELEEQRTEMVLILDKVFTQANYSLKQNMVVLKALDPRAPIKKGFALVKDKQGNIIRSVREANKRKSMNIVFSDGNVDAKVVSKSK